MFSMFKKLGLVFCVVFLPGPLAMAEVPEHYYNPPENINPDPNYTPGDLPLADIAQSEMIYYAKKTELAAKQDVADPKYLTTLGRGEITFSSIKNETKPVLGYFRDFWGLAFLGENGPASVEFVIDVNSLDTGVPGRNHRILNLFFESMKPEWGTVVVNFSSFDLGGLGWADFTDGVAHPLTAGGTVTLNGVTRSITAKLNAAVQNNTWVIESAEPLKLLISDFDFGERPLELMRSCNHASLGNAVEIKVKLYFK